MMTLTDTDSTDDLDDTAEDMREILSELDQIAADMEEVWQRQARARELRMNEWEGQSEDGRKHADALGEQPRPFEGASDVRVPLIDMIINDKVIAAKTAFFRASVQGVPVEPSDGPKSAQVSTLFRFLRDKEMRAELESEVELSAQYLYGDDPALVVVEVSWLRDQMLEKQFLSFDQLAAMYATGAPTPDAAVAPEMLALIDEAMLADFMDLATSGSRWREFEDWMAAAFPGVSPRAITVARKELVAEGQTELPVPKVRQNRPCVQALRFGEDVFFPVGTSDLQRARSIHRREWLSEVELRERVVTMGWDSDVVDMVLERGRGETVIDGARTQTMDRNAGLTLSSPYGSVNETAHLFEIWWSYDRRADELGVPGIYVTVWNGSVRDLPLRQLLLDYPHGKYPFVARSRERLGRQLTDSRGLTKPIATHQGEVKVQRDARSNHTQLSTTPPMKVKMYRGGLELVLAPNAQVPVQKMDDFEWLQPPQFPTASVEMEKTTRNEADEYCGRMVPGADPNRIALIQQAEVDTFFALWREVFGQVFQLCQYYYTPQELGRITGAGPMGQYALSSEDIRGQWDCLIEIDARDLNLEFVAQKMKAFGQLLTFDNAGMLDRGPFVAWAAASVDPVLARQTVRPANNVTQREVMDAKNAVVQMADGIEPEMPTQGINAKLRLETVQSTIMQSQKLQQQFRQDPQFAALVQNYMKYLMQQVAQEQNKIVGLLGTQPMQQSPGLGAPMGEMG